MFELFLETQQNRLGHRCISDINLGVNLSDILAHRTTTDRLSFLKNTAPFKMRFAKIVSYENLRKLKLK
jgi:hypothetical protein